MSNFERRIQSVSRQELGRFAERLLPDQCPDLKPLLDAMSQLLNLSMDIKSEIAMLDSYVKASDNLRKEEETNQSDPTNNGDLSGGNIRDEIKRRLREFVMDTVFGDDEGGDSFLDMLKDLLLNWASEKLNDVGLQWEELLDIYRTVVSTINSIQLSSINDKLGGVTDNYPFNTWNLLVQVNRDIMKMRDYLLNGAEEGQNLNQLIHDAAEDLHTQLGSVSQLIESLGSDIAARISAQNLFLNQIYDKIAECCVKDDVSILLEKTSNITDSVDEVRTLLEGGTPTSTRNAQGEIMTQLRVLQGQIEDIRRLL